MFVESKVPTRHEVLALLLLTGGVCITIFEGNAMGNLSGLGLAIAGAVAAETPLLCDRMELPFAAVLPMLVLLIDQLQVLWLAKASTVNQGF